MHAPTAIWFRAGSQRSTQQTYPLVHADQAIADRVLGWVGASAIVTHRHLYARRAATDVDLDLKLTEVVDSLGLPN